MAAKITELTDGTPAQGTDQVRVARSSGGGYVDRRLTLGDIAGLISNVTVTGGDTLRIADFEDGVNTAGTGAARTLSSLGYTNGTAATEWPLTAALWGSIVAADVDYDTVVIQEAFETLRLGSNKIRKLVGGEGYFTIGGHEVYLPSYKSTGNGGTYDPQQFHFDGHGCMFRVLSTASYGFTSNITDQTEADNDCIDNRWTFGNCSFRGQGTGTAIRFGGSRSAKLYQLEVNNFDTGIQVGFMLNALYENIATVNCQTNGMLVDKGWWSGAGYSTAGNQPLFMNCRFRTTDTDQYGCKVIGADSAEFYRCTVEGTNGLYGIYIDNSVSSVSKNAVINGLHSEIGGGLKFTNAIIGVKGSDPYTFEVRRVYSQGGAGVVLVESESTNATNHIVIRDCLAGSTQFKLTQINSGGVSSWDMKNVTLAGNPTSSADVVDTIGFPNIWTTATVPTVGRVRWESPLN